MFSSDNVSFCFTLDLEHCSPLLDAPVENIPFLPSEEGRNGSWLKQFPQAFAG